MTETPQTSIISPTTVVTNTSNGGTTVATTTTSISSSTGGDAFPIDAPVILAYFPSWSENGVSTGQESKLRDAPAFVNHLFLGFAKPNLQYEKGSYDLSGTGIEVPYDGCTLKESVAALKTKGINVIFSVGGKTYSRDENSYNIDYQQIKYLVDDIGFAGIDWDFEPDGSFQQIGSTINVNRFITFFTESRKLMPREEGYLLACAPAGVGALGGQFNDDPSSPYRYDQRNALTGESDALLFQGTQPTNGINLFGFGSTGHMIPVIEAVGDEIDLIAFQGYNTGASTNRKIMHDAYAHYAAQYGFVVAAGVHYPPEPWGPFYEYTHENVADLSEHIYSHPNRGERNDGIMIWQLLLEGAESSAYSYLNTASKALTERLLLLRWKKLIFLLSSHIAGVHQAARKGRQGVLQPFVTLRSIILPINTLILELKLYTIVKFGKISGGSTRMNCLAQTTDGKKLEIVVKGNDVVNIKIATCKIVGYGKCILEEIS